MVSLDSLEKNKQFAESLDANFPLLSDPKGTVAKAYGVLRLARMFAGRTTFYIDPDGIHPLHRQGCQRPDTRR